MDGEIGEVVDSGWYECQCGWEGLKREMKETSTDVLIGGGECTVTEWFCPHCETKHDETIDCD